MLPIKDLLNPDAKDPNPAVTESLKNTTNEESGFTSAIRQRIQAKLRKKELNRKNYLRMKTDPKWIAKRELKKQMKILASKVDSQPQILLTPASSTVERNPPDNEAVSPHNQGQLPVVTQAYLSSDFLILNSTSIQKIAELEKRLTEERWVSQSIRNQNLALQQRILALENLLASKNSTSPVFKQFQFSNL